MEFKEFLLVLKTRGRLFWSLWLGLTFFGLIIFFVIPTKNEAVLSLDVTREHGDSSVEEYQYDQFYRLEADDKFTEAVVQWLDDPNFQRRISEKLKGSLSDEQIESAIESFSSEKKASNFLQVRFDVESPKEATIVAIATKGALEEKVASLAGDQEDSKWFRLVVSGPTVELVKVSFALFAAILIVLGLSISIFIVFATHYFQEDEDKKQTDENRN